MTIRNEINGEDDATELFRRWFKNPLEKLKTIENGDGGFIALAVSCFLLERYVEGGGNFSKGIVEIFKVSTETANKFKEIVRNGLLHQAMPKQINRGKDIGITWKMNGEYKDAIKIETEADGKCLKINPWEFTSKVIEKFMGNQGKIAGNISFPWAEIHKCERTQQDTTGSTPKTE